MADEHKYVDYLRRASAELQSLRGELRRIRARAEEPMAIIGMGCRYPGGVTSPDELWALVANAGDAVTELPRDRGWDLARLHDPGPEPAAWTSYVGHGGFLTDVASFDADFFNISPREAPSVDPQHRLLLECSVEAVERAGIPLDSLRGKQVGVFNGIMSTGVPGQVASLAAGRVAYTFGFEGPALTVDTACSSSLVALHLAAQALRHGECDLALVGGATVMATPDMLVYFSRQRGLAPDGRCKSFGATADGTGLAEGAGVLLLELLSDARRLGHPVLALVRGSAVNQDGQSNGITAPNGPAQQRVIRAAMSSARVLASDVDVVEAHGTGTRLGDPIEAQAIIATYGADRPEDRPVLLGSLKSNIGHTQAAAGVAGVIKMVQAMHHGVVPPTLHVDAPSPHVDWSAGAAELVTRTVSWPETGRPRRAAVSSFGLSGTNAHVILEQGDEPAVPDPVDRPIVTGVAPLLLSAKTEEALRGQAERLRSWVDRGDTVAPVDIAAALATMRHAMPVRAAVLGADRADLLRGLDALAAGDAAANVFQVAARPDGHLAVMFTGQGAQRPQAGQGLHDRFPVFAEALDDVCSIADEQLERPLRTVMFARPDTAHARLLDRTDYTQAATFALEVALFRLIESWGVRPAFLIGHSVGELTAAHVAGVWSLRDAAKVVVERGRLMAALPDGGAMVAVAAAEDWVRGMLVSLGTDVSVAAVNGPAATVISGDGRLVDEVAAACRAAGVRTKPLRTSHAFHSARMAPVLDPFARVLESVAFRAPRTPVVSNVTGALLTDEQACSPGYWVSQVRETVRFAEGIRTLHGRGVSRFLELGPDTALTVAARTTVEQVSDSRSELFTALLRRGRQDVDAALSALALLHTDGVAVDWEAVFGGRPARRVELPTYAFQGKRYWSAPGSGVADAGGLGLDVVQHPFLRAAADVPGTQGLLMTGRLSVETHPWLADHAPGGNALLPGTALVELAARAGADVDCPVVRDLTLHTPLALSGRAAARLRVALTAPDEHGARSITVHSRREDALTADPWLLHASGTVIPQQVVVPETAELTGEWPPPGAVSVDLDGAYERLAGHGLDYGPAFRGVRAVWRRGDDVFADVALPDDRHGESAAFVLHPALWDAAVHALALAGFDDDDGKARLPYSWQGVSVHNGGALALRVRLSWTGEEMLSMTAADPSGAPVVTVETLRLRAVSTARLSTPVSAGEALFHVEWQPAPRDGSPSLTGGWAVIGPDDARLTGALRQSWGDGHWYPDLAAMTRSQESDVPAPAVVVLVQPPTTEVGAGVPAAVRAAVSRMLSFLRSWLADERQTASRLVVVTRGAVTGDARDVAAAAVWGLLRSAQTEHPGRIVVVDLDGTEASDRALSAITRIDEPQLAIREGELLVPRLARLTVPEPVVPSLAANGTVMITGATGSLGAAMAGHLVTEHGVRRLLLVSRRGPAAEGAAELVAELGALGAEASVVACDVSDRAELATLLSGVPADRPLTGIVHAAGALADGMIESLSEERLDTVLRPKVDAAWHLHELTEGLDLRLFAVFSSLSGTLGGAGQANYAAANAFLDALAAHRRALGLPAQSLAWGAWETDDGMAGRSAESDRERVARSGLLALPAKEALALFDLGWAADEPVVVPARLDVTTLRRTFPVAEQVPPLLRGLIRSPRSTTAGTADRSAALRAQLAELSEQGQRRELLRVVREHVAAVLGHPAPGAVTPDRGFLDLGLDSLTGVELRNRLDLVTGLRLPSTLIFDYPTSLAVAEHLWRQLFPPSASRAGPGADDAGIRLALTTIPVARLRAAGVLDTLLRLAEEPGTTDPATPATQSTQDSIRKMAAEDLVRLALGRGGS
ncbi:type I polyketide synthase [Actinophytocola algeriensis]|uniref:Acyl transferase domain-containing protein n=1 Tax=Actinophytocola algeriensis TaxID=1768010 RepID=A0A7W7QBT6_9PSEU|nr:type I polyketide synthase [Actinophytocola algeriensis]MBB4910657.1 acyl transferase domain-containing protein [Actinophytocola algeriensis]MBE1473650.1 acyl transferase domain-containing protein [Actinophytocola algeriensis]